MELQISRAQTFASHPSGGDMNWMSSSSVVVVPQTHASSQKETRRNLLKSDTSLRCSSTPFLPRSNQTPRRLHGRWRGATVRGLLGLESHRRSGWWHQDIGMYRRRGEPEGKKVTCLASPLQEILKAGSLGKNIGLKLPLLSLLGCLLEIPVCQAGFRLYNGKPVFLP